VAKRIVDLLEMVDVDRQDGETAAAPHVCDRLFDPLAEQHAVGQPSQRIVPRHVGDARLGLTPFGHVLISGDDAAFGGRPMGAGHHATTGQLDEMRTSGLVANEAALVVDQLLNRLTGVITRRHAELEDVPEGHTGHKLLARQTENLPEPSVDHLQPTFLIEQAEALRHVVERRVEP